MNYLTDTKNLVKNSYLDSNKFLFTDRANSSGNADKTAFSKVLAQAQAQNGVNSSSTQAAFALNPNAPTVSIKAGDTLSSIVKNYFAAQGQNINSSDSARLAQALARSNGIQNADKIYPGQQLNLSALGSAGTSNSDVAALGTSNTVTSAASGVLINSLNPRSLAPSVSNGQNNLAQLTNLSARNIGRSQSNTTLDSGDTPILNKTLDRAVEKGFIPAQEKAAVYEKIVNMSKTYQFHPDDFARLTLMESDGMNPKATNNKCHGIIQFCEGPDRGAASAGFAANPKDITNHSVLQQLDLVSKYFDETGLKNFGPASLDDLYLTVLTPAARSETRAHANLNIAGSQASMLHVNRDTSAPITRHSIIEGLHQNAINRLGLDLSSSTVAQNSSNTGLSNPVSANAFAQTAFNNPLNSRAQALMSAQTSLITNNNQENAGVNAAQSNVQLMQATLLAQANQLSQKNANPSSGARNQVAQLDQAQYSVNGASNSRAQSLRVSAYLNQTYLP